MNPEKEDEEEEKQKEPKVAPLSDEESNHHKKELLKVMASVKKAKVHVMKQKLPMAVLKKFF